MTLTHVIILDFEATCDERAQPRPQEIIEFPSVLLALPSLETVDELESFVRPHHHPTLSEFCTAFTSIRQADVDAADPFASVLARHHRWLASHGIDERNGLFVTCGDWDLGVMLPAQVAVSVPAVDVVPPIYGRWQNIKRAFASVRGRKKAPGMDAMLKDMGLPLVGHHHRGIDDCRNIAQLFRALVGQGAIVEPSSGL